jgi:Zn-dependent peptidase ImmA (M78 family)
MKSYYQMTYLEQWTEDLLKGIGVEDHFQLNIEMIAQKLNIWIYYKPILSKGLEVQPGMYTMNLDSRLSPERKWLDFLHELCHLLRHAGNQAIMPKQFTQAQELEADHFVQYAAVPFYIIKESSLPANKGEAIGYIARKFKVPLHFARKRYEQIEERVRQGGILNALQHASESSKYTAELAKSSMTTNTGHNGEARIQAYYGWEGDFSRPEALIIEHPFGFDWNGSLDVQVDRDYKTCEAPLMSKTIASVLPGDISISATGKGSVTINLSRVAWRHGHEATRLFLPMEAVDDALNF